jgi:general stress protein YciG
VGLSAAFACHRKRANAKPTSVSTGFSCGASVMSRSPSPPHVESRGLSGTLALNESFSHVLKRNDGRAMEQQKRSSTRGFASMDPDKQRAIARKGGESVPNEKRSFSQNPTLAAEAGRKGGQSVNPAKRSFSQNHELASAAGRKGGHASHGGSRTKSGEEATG